MKRFLTSEKTIMIISFIGLMLAGSDAAAPVWPWNCLSGVVLLVLAGLLALNSRPVPWR